MRRRENQAMLSIQIQRSALFVALVAALVGCGTQDATDQSNARAPPTATTPAQPTARAARSAGPPAEARLVAPSPEPAVSSGNAAAAPQPLPQAQPQPQ